MTYINFAHCIFCKVIERSDEFTDPSVPDQIHLSHLLVTDDWFVK